MPDAPRAIARGVRCGIACSSRSACVPSLASFLGALMKTLDEDFTDGIEYGFPICCVLAFINAGGTANGKQARWTAAGVRAILLRGKPTVS